ncbi:peptidoglycan DD-metalloendopeptidase family protein [Rhodohalobacter sp. 8-1]|uniref:peptidoglycan DD-metalloendopeptidase family protein n=1 Tax=Rhodohalobacter sp. 8-1 TaxID=3131972 RepID=UPI0030ED693B
MKETKIKSSPVMKPPFRPIPRMDFENGFDPARLKQGWAIGGYNVHRRNMYIAPQYKNERNVHMGVDIWAPAGEPVFSALDGVVAYSAFHDQDGNYGATLVLRHIIGGETFYALSGHLSRSSLEHSKTGKKVSAGTPIGWLGEPHENGNWHPHLHYQLSRTDPGEADMPGVVSDHSREQAKQIYPDPEKVLGSLVG